MAASRTAACLTGGSVAVFLSASLAAYLPLAGTARAFPFVDPTNQDSLPTGAPAGTELPSTDVQGLRNQLRLTNPGAAGNPSGWTILPRLTLQEMFTDNAYEVKSPRLADAITVVAPGISITADTRRLQLSLDYQPNLIMHAINGPLNALTQQLTAIGLLTVVPDLAFVDVRALSGVQSRLGSLAGAGTLGAGTLGTGANASQGPTGGGVGVGQGLNRNNEVQTTSFGIAPYLLRQFGDYGTGKIGVSVDVSSYNTINGFAASPFPSGGTNGQSLLTTEEIAHYSSGEFFDKLQYVFDVDVSQSRSQNNGGTAVIGNTNVAVPTNSFTSQRQTINNSLNYALTRSLTATVSAGEQHIQYSAGTAPSISGLTWNVGLTYTPSPNSSATISYGHYNGTNAFQANGYFAIGGRSLVTFNYSNTVGTQLENLQSQLNGGVVGQLGQLISANTGTPTLLASNALGIQNGVFRFNTATVSWETDWLRDTLQATLAWQEQTSINPSEAISSISFDFVNGAFIETVNGTPTTVAGPSSDVLTGTVNWTHQLSPDLLLNSSASYSFIRRSGGLNDSSLSTGVSLRYILSASTTATASYSFFDRVSKIPGYSLYENLLLLGITKQF